MEEPNTEEIRIRILLVRVPVPAWYVVVLRSISGAFVLP
jgi:hypothetical protein